MEAKWANKCVLNAKAQGETMELKNAERKFKTFYLIICSCHGSCYIPANYLRCPKCGGQGEGIITDCKLCNDLCYVTEPYVPCTACGTKGNAGILRNCSVCNGLGFVAQRLIMGNMGGGFGGYGPHMGMAGPMNNMMGPHMGMGGLGPGMPMGANMMYGPHY